MNKHVRAWSHAVRRPPQRSEEAGAKAEWRNARPAANEVSSRERP